MKLPHYIINRITPPAEGEKGVTLQCTAVNGGLTPHQGILVTPSGTEAEIRKVQPFIGDSYLVTIKGCIRTRLKEGGALLPLKWSCFQDHAALFVQSGQDLPRGNFLLNPPGELKALYPKGPVEARISGKPGFPLCLVETRFNIPFIPLIPWTITEGERKLGTVLYCVDKQPREHLHKGELEMFAGFFKKSVSEKNLFLLRLKLNPALYVPPELQHTDFNSFVAIRDLRIHEKLHEKTLSLISKRSAAQGGVKIAELAEASGLPEEMVRIMVDSRTDKEGIVLSAGWVVRRDGDPESRLSPTGREVLKKIREKGTTGTRRVLIKDPVLLKTVDELCRMDLIFSDGDVVLPMDACRELAERIAAARRDNPEATPSELAVTLGVQRKVIFTVIKKEEDSAG